MTPSVPLKATPKKIITVYDTNTFFHTCPVLEHTGNYLTWYYMAITFYIIQSYTRLTKFNITDEVIAKISQELNELLLN